MWKIFKVLFLLVVVLLPAIISIQTNIKSNVCIRKDFFRESCMCHPWDDAPQSNRIYILYDINSVEGFNLRRDVYIRLAVFLHYIRANCPTFKNAKLVLPPFHRLYHWKNTATDTEPIFWNNFFDLKSLQRYTVSLDIWQYFQETSIPKINQLIQLGNFPNMFEDGRFVEKFEITNNMKVNGEPRTYYAYPNVTIERKSGVRFQGSAMQLEELLKQMLTR